METIITVTAIAAFLSMTMNISLFASNAKRKAECKDLDEKMRLLRSQLFQMRFKIKKKYLFRPVDIVTPGFRFTKNVVIYDYEAKENYYILYYREKDGGKSMIDFFPQTPETNHIKLVK